jgi:DNA integrity scanning protein DisA with diadenylate cyclase activity
LKSYLFLKGEKILHLKIYVKNKKKTGNTISKTSVFYLLNNKLKYKYLKIMPKTNKLKQISSIIRTFIFIKVIAKALLLKMKIIYLNESNFQLENNI